MRGAYRKPLYSRSASTCSTRGPATDDEVSSLGDSMSSSCMPDQDTGAVEVDSTTCSASSNTGVHSQGGMSPKSVHIFKIGESRFFDSPKLSCKQMVGNNVCIVSKS